MPEGIPFGEYRLLRRLGAGGMAEVFLAKRHGPKGFEKQLVIKRILPHLSASERFTRLFLKEARLAALIDHPNLVHVSSFGEISGDYYLAMEFVDGITAAELLTMLGTLTPGVAARIGIEISSALAAIHSAIDERGEPLYLVHRDVTPRNVMLTRDGNAKLLDFGIAITRDETIVGPMGTKRHMSPEQSRGEPLDHRSDLFALGVLLYMLIAGDPPFDKLPEGTLKRPAGVPDQLWTTIAHALAFDPKDRPGSARQMQAELELFVATLGLEGTRAHLSEVVSAVMPRSSGPIARLRERTMTKILKLTAPISGHSDRVEPGARTSAPRSMLKISFALSAAMFVAAIAVLAVKSLRPPETTALPPPPAPAPIAIEEVIEEPEPEPEPEERAPAPKRPKTGTLTIDTKPWSEVYLGAKKLGLTPMEGVKLPTGTHQLELRNPSLGISKRIKVTIRPGKVTRVHREL